MFHDLCIRGFARNMGIQDSHGRCIPGFFRIPRGILTAGLRALFALLRFLEENVQKCTGEGHRNLGRRPLYPRFCPGNPGKPRIQRPRIEKSSISSGNRGKRHIWPRGATFSRFPGFPGIFPVEKIPDLTLQHYFFNFFIKKN